MNEPPSRPHTIYYWHSKDWPVCQLCEGKYWLRTCRDCRHQWQDNPGFPMTNCPLCGLHDHQLDAVPAVYDAKGLRGQWAYVCEFHFQLNLCRVGLGMGQKLVDARGQPESDRLGG